jgi:hypothetical protein
LALLAAWFFVPLPAPESLLSVDVQRGPEASSLDRSYPFQFATDSPQPTLRVHTDLGQGDVLIELLDVAGVAPVLRLPPLGRRHQDSRWTFNVNGGFVAGSQYKLRVAERDVVGNYSLSFAERAGVTLWQRFLALFLVTGMGSGGLPAWWAARSLRRGGQYLIRKLKDASYRLGLCGGDDLHELVKRHGLQPQAADRARWAANAFCGGRTSSGSSSKKAPAKLR